MTILLGRIVNLPRKIEIIESKPSEDFDVLGRMKTEVF